VGENKFRNKAKLYAERFNSSDIDAICSMNLSREEILDMIDKSLKQNIPISELFPDTVKFLSGFDTDLLDNIIKGKK